jgi:hypothetical protein
MGSRVSRDMSTVSLFFEIWSVVPLTDVPRFAVLNDELETTMKMCGVTSVDQVHPGLLNTLAVDHLIPTSDDHPYAKWRPSQRSKI